MGTWYVYWILILLLLYGSEINFEFVSAVCGKFCLIFLCNHGRTLSNEKSPLNISASNIGTLGSSIFFQYCVGKFMLRWIESVNHSNVLQYISIFCIMNSCKIKILHLISSLSVPNWFIRQDEQNIFDWVSHHNKISFLSAGQLFYWAIEIYSVTFINSTNLFRCS